MGIELQLSRKHFEKPIASVVAGVPLTDLTLEEQAEPATPAANRGVVYAEDSNGKTFLRWKDDTGLIQQLCRDNVRRVRNTSGLTMNPGELVYVSGSTGQIPNVALADADDAAKAAEGIVLEQITNNGFGRIMKLGTVRGLNTNGIPEGTRLYLSGTAGAWTTSVPAHPAISQVIGVVVREHINQGIIDIDLGGPNEQATATPTANAIPRADGAGKLAIGWLTTTGVGSTVALQSSAVMQDMEIDDWLDWVDQGIPSTVVGRLQRDGDELSWRRSGPLNTTLEQTHRKGAASGYAGLDGSSQISASVIPNDAVTNARLRDSAATSVIGRSANSSGDPADIAAATESHVLRLVDSVLGFNDPPSPFIFKRLVQALADPHSGTPTVIVTGLPTAPTLTSTPTSLAGVSRPMVRWVTGAASGNTEGLLSAAELLRIGYSADVTFVVSAGNVITSYRLWVGCTSADLSGVATPTTEHVAAFRYDTGVDGTAFWRTVTNDGVGAATVTTTTAAIAAGGTYTLRIVTASASVKFYIDGTLVSTHTTTLPGSTTTLRYQAQVTTLTTATRRFDFGRMGAAMD